MPSIEQVDLPKKQKEYAQFVRTPFHTSYRARYSVLHLLGVLSGGGEPPLCKGRWLAERDGGIVIKQDFIVKQSLSRLRRQLPLHKGAFGLRASKVHLLFLTSTAFVSTKAKPRVRRKLDYNFINFLKSSVSLIGSKQRLLFKQRMKSSTSVISESVTGCSSSISENSGAVNFIVFW